MNVTACSVEAIRHAATWPALVAEYAEESRSAGMPEPNPDWEAYGRLEAAGALFTFGADEDGALVGFLTLLVTPVPRYSRIMALSESFFVAKAWWHTWAGLRLLKAAEDKAQELNALSVSIMAPMGGGLLKVLPRLGYSEVGRSFFKKVSP